MKTLLFFLLSSSVALAANTNEIFFDVLHTAQGDFTNATIIRTTPAYAVVDWPNGLAKVALTNLSPELQKRFGYDPQKAAALVAAEKQHAADVLKQQIEYQKYVASLRGTNQVIRVMTVPDSYGRCQTSVGSVIVQNVPSSVSSWIAHYNQLSSDIPVFAQKVLNDTKAAERADAFAPTGAGGDAAYVAAAMSQRDRATQMVLNANDESDRLKQMEAELDSMTVTVTENTSIVAYPTGLNHSGIPIWQAAGMAR